MLQEELLATIVLQVRDHWSRPVVATPVPQVSIRQGALLVAIAQREKDRLQGLLAVILVRPANTQREGLLVCHVQQAVTTPVRAGITAALVQQANHL